MIVEEHFTAELAKEYMAFQPRAWEIQASCRPGARPVSVLPKDFFASEKSKNLLRAKQLCDTCPVRVACLLDALAVGEIDGLRGGFNMNIKNERDAASEWLKELGFAVPRRIRPSMDELIGLIQRSRDQEPKDRRAVYRPLEGEPTHRCYSCKEELSLRAWGGNRPRKPSDWCNACRCERRLARQAS